MIYTKTIEGKIYKRIMRKKAPILLREDFDDLGGYDQVGRALKSLVRKGKLLRIGYGLYAKATTSSLSGKTVPIKPLPDLARIALDRMGIQTKPTKAERDYEAGRSTQVPTGRLIGVGRRVKRKISYNDATIHFEYSSNK